MISNFNQYVVYNKSIEGKTPFGVVSENFECKAETSYIPTSIKQFLVEIEDQRFYDHIGIDFIGILRAAKENIKAKSIVQGGSSITQQLARNILNDNSKTFARKIKETVKAIQIERKYSKNEILDLYFNNVYFGKNIKGIRTAGLYYFRKETDRLNQSELLWLLTILRGPNYYISNPNKTQDRFNIINKILFEREVINTTRFRKNLKARFKPVANHLQIIRNNTIPFITESYSVKDKTIYSSIDKEIQVLINQFVSDSKYPVSIIAINNKKVVGFASSYGSEYPFLLKTNIGSTVKPFLYCFLREMGIEKTDSFNAYSNRLDWNVREVNYHKHELTLEEALYYSNNNAFINACTKVGLESSLNSLATAFKIPKDKLFPSSILGATKKGISLHELACAYSEFFYNKESAAIKTECLGILNAIAETKLAFGIENVFLKTGTTNDNKERFAVIGNPIITFAILRNENLTNDASKEGGFLKQIKKHFNTFFKSKKNYRWS